MISVYDETTAQDALGQPLDPALRKSIEARWSDALSLGLNDQTHILVIQPEDTEEVIQGELGWSPLVHPIEETRFGSKDFQPYWSWLQDLGGWYELLHTVGNAGFAYILLIDKGSSDFARMCREADGQPCAF